MKKIIPLCLVILSLSFIQCSGKKVAPGESSNAPVPEELVKSFEVQEYKPKEAAKEIEPAANEEVSKKGKTKKTAKKAESKSAGAATADATKKDVTANGFEIPNRRPKVEPLWVGEKVWLDVTWLKTRAGEFELSVLPFKEINGRKVYDIKGEARTADFFAFIYKAEDSVESFVDYYGWFPHKFLLKGQETRYIRDYVELYDHAQKKQYVKIYNKRLKTGEIIEDNGFKDLTPFSQDSISSLYYLRTQKLEKGTSVYFPMTTSGKSRMTEVKVLGPEEISTRMGTMRAIKTQVFTEFKGGLKQQDDSFIWFSDDERKFPVKFEAKVKIGWVTGIVKKIEKGTPPPAEGAMYDAQSSGRSVASANTNEPTGKKAWFSNLIDKNPDKE